MINGSPPLKGLRSAVSGIFGQNTGTLPRFASNPIEFQFDGIPWDGRVVYVPDTPGDAAGQVASTTGS